MTVHRLGQISDFLRFCIFISLQRINITNSTCYAVCACFGGKRGSDLGACLLNTLSELICSVIKLCFIHTFNPITPSTAHFGACVSFITVIPNRLRDTVAASCFINRRILPTSQWRVGV